MAAPAPGDGPAMGPILQHPSLTSFRAREANQGIVALFIISLALHAFLIGWATLESRLRPPLDLTIKSLPVELVTLGTPRDEKLLPRKVKPLPPEQGPEPQPEAAAEPVAAPEPIADPEPAANAVPIETKTDKPDQKVPESKTPPPENRSKPRRKLSNAARRLLRGAPDGRLDDALKKLEAREGQEKGSPFGTTTDPTRAANEYEADVAGVLKSKYRLPETIPPSQRRFLGAELVLFIDRKGRITRYEFTKRHSNQAFMSALERLLRSVQLPPPPKALARTYASTGLAVRFKP